ncbi:MAG: diaminopimelate decarboxylase [Planctomycetes bacterium]|nr:diaminopimelate decarboxylase [Planctomycetota bacterium]
MRPAILDDARLSALAREHGTPLFVYDAATICARYAELSGFDVVRYAQKANPNLSLLALLRECGAAIDAVSAGEIERALAAGFAPNEIVYTADLFDRAALEGVARHGIHVNVGSRDMLAQLAAVQPRADVTLRINPGFGHGHHRKVTTGGSDSKHGIWHEELPVAIDQAREFGLRVVGLHLHVGSGASFSRLVRAGLELVHAAERVETTLSSISAGGGLPVRYRATDREFPLERYAESWRAGVRSIEARARRPISLEIEPGRWLVAESGVLVTEVRATKRQGEREFVLVDAGFHNLIRPTLYGAYHEIRALAKLGPERAVVVAGPLCESSDVFTQVPGGALAPILLPPLVAGDLLAIHDVGAYGTSMASNYNSQPIAAEVLVDGERSRLIRRRQRFDELFAPERELL